MSRRKKKLEAEVAAFIRQYGRKSDPRVDPNDRQYDRKIEEIVKRMSPEELDRLMHGEDEDEETP